MYKDFCSRQIKVYVFFKKEETNMQIKNQRKSTWSIYIESQDKTRKENPSWRKIVSYFFYVHEDWCYKLKVMLVKGCTMLSLRSMELKLLVNYRINKSEKSKLLLIIYFFYVGPRFIYLMSSFVGLSPNPNYI